MRRAWSDIAATYRQLAERGGSAEPGALGNLAEHIHSNLAGHSLFGWTSVYDLCIAQRDDQEKSPNSLPYLRLSPIGAGRIEFCYVDSPIGAKAWRREDLAARGDGRGGRPPFRALHAADGLGSEGLAADRRRCEPRARLTLASRRRTRPSGPALTRID